MLNLWQPESLLPKKQTNSQLMNHSIIKSRKHIFNLAVDWFCCADVDDVVFSKKYNIWNVNY